MNKQKNQNKYNTMNEWLWRPVFRLTHKIRAVNFAVSLWIHIICLERIQIFYITQNKFLYILLLIFHLSLCLFKWMTLFYISWFYLLWWNCLKANIYTAKCLQWNCLQQRCLWWRDLEPCMTNPIHA